MTFVIQAVLEDAIEKSPFIKFLGLKIAALDIKKATVTVSMPVRAEFLRSEGPDTIVHGGPVAALIDTAGDFAIAIGVGGIVPTINFRVDYLRPATGNELTAVATSRRVGRTVSFADVDVFDSEGRLCAVGRGCYSSIKG